MRRPPVRIRTFLLGTVLIVLLAPTLAGGAAWFVERDHQRAGIQHRLNAATAYVTSNRTELREAATIKGFGRLLDRLDLLAQLVVVSTSPPGKEPVYLSPALDRGQAGRSVKAAAVAAADISASWSSARRIIPIEGSKSASRAPAIVVADLYYRPASRTARALAALLAGLVVLLAGLAVAVWLAGRWMVAPLARLSGQVDMVAGGELAIAVPQSRIGEIANIAQAVEGMTAALGETAQRRADADEARRFLVTSIAHDLRTPLFALRGHLQAIRTRLGDPAVHLERAEARADALERLVGNLFAYTRDDYAQPAPQLEPILVVDLLHEVAASLEHATRLHDNTFDLEGDRALAVVVDRDRVKRALTNILDNAVRYSPPGAPIRLSWVADASSVEITVHDRGPGIDPDLLPHVFEPGIRGTAVDRSPHDGAGLGLTIAKRLLEHQHATISVHNQSTDGAVISVTLQRVLPSDPS